MTASSAGVERADADLDEVLHVARGIATAVAPESGLTDVPVAEVRDRLHIPPKSAEVVAVGSPGPFDPGGISEHQRAAAARAADG